MPLQEPSNKQIIYHKKGSGMHPVVSGLYSLAWHVALPVLALSPRLREGWDERRGRVTSSTKMDVWIQAASVGESLLAVEISKRLFDYGVSNIVISTNTSQGYSMLKRDSRITPMFFPFDIPRVIRNYIHRWQPGAIVLLETEIWPGLLSASKEFGIPILIINGRLSAKSLKRYLIIKRLWRVLSPTKVLAVSNKDAARFSQIFPFSAVEVMDNIKFDVIKLDPNLETTSSELAKLIPSSHPFIVLGSIRKKEEKDILNLIGLLRKKKPNAVIGLFPRHMHRLTYWQKVMDNMGDSWTFRTRITHEVAPGTIVLWDKIGELKQAYSLASAAFVGGSLQPCGGQNFLEPLAYGVVPCVGPFRENFEWIGDELFNMGLAVQVKDWIELAERLLAHVEGPPLPKEEVIRMARGYVEGRKGGAKKACEEILKYL